MVEKLQDSCEKKESLIRSVQFPMVEKLQDSCEKKESLIRSVQFPMVEKLQDSCEKKESLIRSVQFPWKGQVTPEYHYWDYYPGAPIFQPNHCNWFEDWAFNLLWPNDTKR